MDNFFVATYKHHTDHNFMDNSFEPCTVQTTDSVTISFLLFTGWKLIICAWGCMTLWTWHIRSLCVTINMLSLSFNSLIFDGAVCSSMQYWDNCRFDTRSSCWSRCSYRGWSCRFKLFSLVLFLLWGWYISWTWIWGKKELNNLIIDTLMMRGHFLSINTMKHNHTSS